MKKRVMTLVVLMMVVLSAGSLFGWSSTISDAKIVMMGSYQEWTTHEIGLSHYNDQCSKVKMKASTDSGKQLYTLLMTAFAAQKSVTVRLKADCMIEEVLVKN